MSTNKISNILEHALFKVEIRIRSFKLLCYSNTIFSVEQILYPPEQREVNLLVESSWWLKKCFAGKGFARPHKLFCSHKVSCTSH